MRKLIFSTLAAIGLALLTAGAALARPTPLGSLRTLQPGTRVWRDPWTGDTLVRYAEPPPDAHNFDHLLAIASERPVRAARRRPDAARG